MVDAQSCPASVNIAHHLVPKQTPPFEPALPAVHTAHSWVIRTHSKRPGRPSRLHAGQRSLADHPHGDPLALLGRRPIKAKKGRARSAIPSRPSSGSPGTPFAVHGRSTAERRRGLTQGRRLEARHAQLPVFTVPPLIASLITLTDLLRCQRRPALPAAGPVPPLPLRKAQQNHVLCSFTSFFQLYDGNIDYDGKLK